MKNIFDEGYQFLIKILINKAGLEKEEATKILDEHINNPNNSLEDNLSLAGYYKNLLNSAQNANMKNKVIGGSIGGFENIGLVLYNFNPHQVLSHYSSPEILLDKIEAEFFSDKEIRKTTRSLWPQYCRTILSAATFFSQFKEETQSKEEKSSFRNWLFQLYDDPKTQAVLPLILEQEIHGIGYALACDFLKELGLVNYGKPDVHLKRILRGINYIDGKTTDYQAQKAIQKIAQETRKTPYAIDKVLWLIGSGQFYRKGYTIKGADKNGSIGSFIKEFIEEFNK